MRGDPGVLGTKRTDQGLLPNDAISSPFGAELWSCCPRPTGVIHPERNRFLVTVSSVSEGEQRASVPVIDMWAPIVPSCEIIDDLRLGFPTEQLQYLDVFTKTSVSEEQFGDYAQGLRRTDDQILAALDEAGISRSIITGFDERSTCGVTFVHNESIAALAERHPDRFIPFAGADIMRGGSALAELERWVLERGFRCTGIDVRPVIGYPALAKASTSYVERQNLSMRMGMRRFTRLTNGFSNKVENLAHAVWLHYMNYNFARSHQTLTQKNGGHKTTPAMAAGIERRVWMHRDIAALPD